MLFSSFFITTVILVFLTGYSSSCSEHEFEAECVNPCNTCEQRGRCDSPPPCQQGCDCKPGFFRDDNGYCVPEQQCLVKTENPRCPKNAVFLSCCPLVPPTCENPYPESDDEDECVPGCACRPGFLKRRDGRCVTPERCYSPEERDKETPGVCRLNEEYYECTPSCKNTCQNINNPGVKCRCGPPGCFCREGLVKRADGKCVQPSQCPSDPKPKCPKNAIFIKCGSPCPPTCDDLQPKPCEEKCITACYCKPGYLKRKDEVCVRPMDCQLPKKQDRQERKCPENAIFIECGSPCPPTCENRMPEPCEEKCTKACYCKPGYLLSTKEGKCVKPEHCNTSRKVDPVRCPENEEPSECIIPCNDCKTKGNCQFFACNKGCDCKKDYYRNKNGKCIHASECAQITDIQSKCAADEQFYACTPSCKNTCANINNPAAKCQCAPAGCFCKEGLVKRDDGKCVPIEQCEVALQPKCNEDEQFYECTPSCRNTCENFTNRAARCYCGPPGCFCKEGLVKRADGKCVPPKQCQAKPEACPENAEFTACGPSCRPTCGDPFPAACGAECVKGCFCQSGFVQDTDGRCVQLENCSRKCLHHSEEFQECGSACPDTCENRGRHPPGSCPYRCARGCFCKKGLYRTKDGHCVPLKECDAKTTSKPQTTRKNKDSLAAPDDCHGCPSAAECETYCKSLGDYAGLCTGDGGRHCRCA